MKKLIALLLALVMVFSMVACAGGGEDKAEDKPAADSPAADSPAAPKDDKPAGPAGPAQDPTASSDAGSVGYWDDDVDHFARETYDIIDVYMYPGLLTEIIIACWETLGKELNYNMHSSGSNGDAEVYLQNLEAAGMSGKYDGFFLGGDATVGDRAIAIMEEIGKPYITIFSPLRDESGAALAPCILLDGYSSGATCVQWFYDNYKTYWGDIDESKIALCNITFSIVEDIQSRADGAEAKFKELLPNNAIYDIDSVVSGVSAETAYNEVTRLISGNPDVEYWWITTGIEDLAQGATRAVEALGKEGNVLVTTVGSDLFVSEHDNGYEGNVWVSCIGISNYIYAAPAAAGMVAMIDGRATMDTLWQEIRAEGDKATVWLSTSDIVTRENYKNYFAEKEAFFIGE